MVFAFLPAAPITRPSNTATTFRCNRLHQTWTVSKPRATRLNMMSTSAQPETKKAPKTLGELFTAMRDLGTMRFISVSNGAVLETIGRLDYAQSTFSIPSKGTYLTLSSVDKTFECHINVSKACSVTLSSEPAKIGNHLIHVLRILDQHNSVLLSCMLMWDPSQGPGHYLHGAVDEFSRLQTLFGDKITLTPPNQN